MTREVLKDFVSGDELAKKAASDLANAIGELLSNHQQVHIVLTGGTVGIKTLGFLAPYLANMNLSKLHLWWGDERFVESESKDRNFVQAHEALLSKIAIPAENIHQMPASDTGSLTEAAEKFRAHIESLEPAFDIVLLGMGPDAHVASLFPASAPTAHGNWVISESDSPKPPSQRISLSYKALSSAKEVWFLVSGQDKQDAVRRVFAGEELPAGKVSGKKLTRWYLDQAASSGITS